MSTQQILSFILSDLTISDIRILRDIANKRKDITESSFSYLQMYFDEVKNDDLLLTMIRNIDTEIIYSKQILDKLVEIYGHLNKDEKEIKEDKPQEVYQKENLKSDLSYIGNNKPLIADKICQIRTTLKNDKNLLNEVLLSISPNDVNISMGALAVLGFHNYDITTTGYGYVNNVLRSVKDMTISEFKICVPDFKVPPPEYTLPNFLRNNAILLLYKLDEVENLNEVLQVIRFANANNIGCPKVCLAQT
ncbi:hypothetical protein TVAG_302760 [Trichomonas vaginalis G3]|uniref:Uncharacterized protein n=1 Tax=Trichomonas vaginalis (strain ATCC PRA-98 / G3) TaxID=412133 RepID=A2FPL2_TRIV3|nr:hypothetical protein TVAG_302760 [Trichomonas vaginalis G3]|eukprot:XP_001306066.1 hypothetical protein [Trichomonas vaginalis G3]